MCLSAYFNERSYSNYYYYAVLLYGTTESNAKKLQRVRNSIARIVTGTKRTEQITHSYSLNSTRSK